MAETILTVTPNPAIDKFLEVRGLCTGEIHRPSLLANTPGGKGLNVSRVVHRLGGQVNAGLLLAGHSGHWVADQLERIGIPARITWGSGETRVCTLIIDPTEGSTISLNEPGEPVDAHTWRRFESDLREILPGAAVAVYSGSLPPGAPEDGYARLLRLAGSRGIPTLLDTHGPALAAALPAKPSLVKVNAEEASEITGIQVNSVHTASLACRRLTQLGAAQAIVTLGREGAVAVSVSDSWWVSAPAVQSVSAIGSGDALMAGIALERARGRALPAALRLGAAAGAANSLTPVAGDVDPETVHLLMGQVQVLALPD